MNKRRKIYVFQTAMAVNGMLSAIFGLSFSVAAQERTDDQSIFQFDEITITGQKIDRKLEETIDSVDVLTTNEIEEGARTQELFHILDKTANVTRSGDENLSIRGISNDGATGAFANSNTIGIFIDNAQLTNRGIRTGAISTWDIGQVEILRGAQSTTSGRNSLAGAIYLKTQDPVFHDEGKSKIGVSSDQGYEFGIVQNKVLSDNWAARVALETVGSDGYVENLVLSDDSFDKENSYNGRGKLLYSGDNGDELLLSISAGRVRDFGDDLVKEKNDDRISVYNEQGLIITDTYNFNSTYSVPLSHYWSFESITSGSQTNHDSLVDADQQNGFSKAKRDADEFLISQELRFSYEDEGLKAVAGAYLATGERDDTLFVKDSAQPIPGGGGLTFNLDSIQSEDEKFYNYALYYNADYKLSKNLTFISGARLDYEERENKVITSLNRVTDVDALNPAFAAANANATIDATLAALVGNGVSEGKTDSINLLPKIGLNYQWSSNVTTGVQYQLGYRPGGVSANIQSGAATDYDEEFTHNYELSVRTNWLDNRLNINANAFFTDWKDQQVSLQGSGGTYDVSVVNAGESHLYGVELQAGYKFNRYLDIDGYVGYTRTEFDEFTAGSDNFTGNEFAYARDVTAGFSVNYRPWEDYYINTNVQYAGDAYSNTSNTKEIDAYSLVNLKAGYEQDNWAVDFYINNLFDRLYVDETSTIAGVALGDPRVIGVTLTMNW